ncbi:RNA polymerase sigma-70 factor (ECF subfamily) [Nocardioides aromaticivorans]|uniref:RNA polymerase sigma-70 factor (ECF subfamily) n=1 Tax=Nocardioides aromaticivorans TaxID=200618 RepID=A0A7Z0CKK0_9ACTN|nr:RNA polymerase sigma factor SigM [Nocardioides aromaticivorans]NYI44836.1 RNA polymerase sigma-70 factor (ECF subfamily) [Nocardioides aromaticivorans]
MASELSEPTDADLLAAHVAGDDSAFSTLFARHRDRLWAVALRTCNDPETAADGLQEGLIAAFRRAGSYRGEAAVTTWLHRIVVNACLDRLRAARVRRAEPLPEDVDDLRPVRQTVGDAVDPADQSVATERRALVRAALGRLSEEQRAAVVLVDMEGYSVAETALILDCAEGTVKSRCSRARAKLAVLLADVLDVTEPTGAGPAAGATDGNPASGPDVGSLTRRGPPAAEAGAVPQAPTVD